MRTPPARGWLRAACLAVVVFAFFSQGLAEVLRSIAEIRTLSPERAALRLPVEIEAQVLTFRPPGLGGFVHDETMGIYLALRDPRLMKLKLTQGQVLRIKGESDPGLFLPHILAQDIEIVGTRPLPAPLPLTRELLYDPTIDCRWVELRGVVLNKTIIGQIISLSIECFGEAISLIVPRTPESERAPTPCSTSRSRSGASLPPCPTRGAR